LLVDDTRWDNGQSEGANDLLDNRIHGLISSSQLALSSVAPVAVTGITKSGFIRAQGSAVRCNRWAPRRDREQRRSNAKP
jgi:hypothetical protein